jgi:uncharacterized membrane protein
MAELWFAAAIWLVTHLGISSTPLRGVLVNTIGQGAYLGLYSLVAAGSLGYLIWVYPSVPSFDYLWLPNPDLYWAAKITMPVAFILLVGGFMVRNPTNVGMSISDTPEAIEQAREMAKGVTRITRHPLQWAIVIWGVGHVIANGDWVSVIFFSTLALLGLIGGYLIDRKKAIALGAGWDAYAAVTSNLPFAAIVSGRNPLVAKELALPVLVGALVYGLVFYFHEAITGAIII